MAAAARVSALRAGSDNLAIHQRSASVTFSDIQQGIGRLVASAYSPGNAVDCSATTSLSTTTTHLTTVAHQAPVRLIPCRASSVARAGAAVCYVSNYGGGLVTGDSLEYHIHVQSNAKLGLLTQGANRVYSSRLQHPSPDEQISDAHRATPKSCETTSNYRIDKGALLVVAPDPITPFAASRYQQINQVHVHPESSLCLIDWFGSGRNQNGEQWQQEFLANQTKLYVTEHNSYDEIMDQGLSPLLVDAVSLRGSDGGNRSKDNDSTTSFQTAYWGGNFPVNAYASMILYGDKVEEVVDRCHILQRTLMEQYTRIRQPVVDQGEATIGIASPPDQVLSNLSGRVVLGISAVPVWKVHNDTQSDSSNQVYLARWAANSNEDLYRLFHYCLQPLSEEFGLSIYKDRIRAAQSATSQTFKGRCAAPRKSMSVSTSWNDAFSNSSSAGTKTTTPLTVNNPIPFHTRNTSSLHSWAYWILADSALPTGSFAHSSGLEAAHQLVLLGDVSDFIQTATKSTLQMSTPFVVKCHRFVTAAISNELTENEATLEEVIQSWAQLDHQVHTLMVTNSPACRSSLDQGRNLLRVAMKWMEAESFNDTSDDLHANRRIELLQGLQVRTDATEHAGHLSCVFGAVTALLNIPEPEACHLLAFCVARDIVSAAVRLNLLGPLASVGVLVNAEQCAKQGVHDGLELMNTVHCGAGCSPVLDAVHPCHDVLSTRLFRT